MSDGEKVVESQVFQNNVSGGRRSLRVSVGDAVGGRRGGRVYIDMDRQERLAVRRQRQSEVDEYWGPG